MAEDRLSLDLVNELAEVGRAGAAVEAFCARNRVPARAAYHIGLAVEEALTNVVSYAFPAGGRHEIALRLELRGDQVTVELVDDGAAFDPLHEAPEPDLSSPLQERRIGGLGVHMIRTFMTGADYSREGGRNRLRLVKRLDPEG